MALRFFGVKAIRTRFVLQASQQAFITLKWLWRYNYYILIKQLWNNKCKQIIYCVRFAPIVQRRIKSHNQVIVDQILNHERIEGKRHTKLKASFWNLTQKSDCARVAWRSCWHRTPFTTLGSVTKFFVFCSFREWSRNWSNGGSSWYIPA